MSKEIKYTSENLFDVKNLRHNIYSQIEECNIQKKNIGWSNRKIT